MSFDFDGHLLILDQVSDSLLLYNPAAARIWNDLGAGRGLEQIALAIAAEHGVAPDTARRDMDAILADWSARGLLAGTGDERPSAAPSPARPPAEWAETWRSRFGALGVEFAFEDRARAVHARRFFAEQDTPDTELRLEIVEIGDGSAAILEGGVERLRTDRTEELIGGLNHVILEHLHPGLIWLAVLHAGAVALGTCGIAFAAAPGSGKTTLTAWLIARGFTYLADDFVALAAPGGSILPWPVPLSVKQGSWPVLAQAQPGLADAPVHRARGLVLRQLAPPPGSWERRPVPLEILIFPQWREGKEARLERLAPVEAVRRLLDDRVWLGCPKTEKGIAAFLDRLKGVESWSLEYGDLAKAETRIRDLGR